MPNKFEVEIAEKIGKELAETPAGKAAISAASRLLEDIVPGGVEKLGQITKKLEHVAEPADEAASTAKRTGRAKAPATPFELPGDGSPQPYNATYEDLWAAMSSKPGKAVTNLDAIPAERKAATSSSHFELPGDGSSRPNSTYDDLNEAMHGSKTSARTKAPRERASKPSRSTRGQTIIDLPGSPGWEGPESILP